MTKVAIITGAGRGLGKAVANDFISQGMRVVLVDVNKIDKSFFEKNIKFDFSENIISFQIDVSKRSEVKNMITKALDKYKKIDYLINFAGINRDAPFLEMSDEEWDSVIAVHLKGTFICCQEFAKNIPNGKILLLENIRFHKEEELNSVTFAKELSKNGDIYINEAFPCSHRAHASVCEITKHINSFAGKQLLEEVNVIKMLTNNAKKPTTCIIGGSKISTKSGILINLIKKCKILSLLELWQIFL